MKIIYALFLLTGIARAGMDVYNPSIMFDGISQDIFYCNATNSNYHYGNIYIFQVNTNLLSTNWYQMNGIYYMDVPGNDHVPYRSPGFPLVDSQAAFIRFVQVGTNYTFYPDLNTNGFIYSMPMMSPDEVDEMRASNFHRSMVSRFNFDTIAPTGGIPDCIYPPGFAH